MAENMPKKMQNEYPIRSIQNADADVVYTPRFTLPKREDPDARAYETNSRRDGLYMPEGDMLPRLQNAVFHLTVVHSPSE